MSSCLTRPAAFSSASTCRQRGDALHFGNLVLTFAWAFRGVREFTNESRSFDPEYFSVFKSLGMGFALL
jgi:hypothetical protein